MRKKVIKTKFTFCRLNISNLRVDQRREPCIRVNIRKLDRELSTGLSILYTSDY